MLFGRAKKNPINLPGKDAQVKSWHYTTCGYCSTGCSIEVGVLPRTEYHDRQMARAKKELTEDFVKLKAMGVKAALRGFKSAARERWQQNLGT